MNQRILLSAIIFLLASCCNCDERQKKEASTGISKPDTSQHVTMDSVKKSIPQKNTGEKRDNFNLVYSDIITTYGFPVSLSIMKKFYESDFAYILVSAIQNQEGSFDRIKITSLRNFDKRKPVMLADIIMDTIVKRDGVGESEEINLDYVHPMFITKRKLDLIITDHPTYKSFMFVPDVYEDVNEGEKYYYLTFQIVVNNKKSGVLLDPTPPRHPEPVAGHK